MTSSSTRGISPERITPVRGGAPVDETKQLSARMPDASANGEYLSIYFRINNGSAYEWQYQFMAEAKGGPAKTPTVEPSARSDAAPGGKTVSVPYQDPVRFNATETPSLADFLWLSPERLQGVLPDGAERMTASKYVCEGWKCYLYGDPDGLYVAMMERFANVYINDSNGYIELLVDWFYVFDGSTGEGFEDSTPDSSFTGVWSDGRLDVLGSGSITLTDFYYLDGCEYAIGTMLWPDGTPLFVALVRP